MLKASILVDEDTMLRLRLEGQRYCLQWGWPGNWRVVYEGDGRTHRRVIGGRNAEYGFRSVEQLRYDFERDAEEAKASRR
jgi:hypothetical protein